MTSTSANKNMLFGGAILAIFALAAALLVGLTHDSTVEIIAENERKALMETLHLLVPNNKHDNDIFTDLIHVRAEELADRKFPFITVYRARKGSEPVAAILEIVTQEGYSGTIKLLVAINYDGTLSGSRVVSHRETPGLGDGIEARKSRWIFQFEGQSIQLKNSKQWQVKKDGGQFDQLTGATISSRAIVKATRKALEYFDIHKHELFLRAQ